jgi:hypothetical protein
LRLGPSLRPLRRSSLGRSAPRRRSNLLHRRRSINRRTGQGSTSVCKAGPLLAGAIGSPWRLASPCCRNRPAFVAFRPRRRGMLLAPRAGAKDEGGSGNRAVLSFKNGLSKAVSRLSPSRSSIALTMRLPSRGRFIIGRKDRERSSALVPARDRRRLRTAPVDCSVLLDVPKHRRLVCHPFVGLLERYRCGSATGWRDRRLC